MKKFIKICILIFLGLGINYGQEVKEKTKRYQIEIVNPVFHKGSNILLKEGEIRFILISENKIIKRISFATGGEEGSGNKIGVYPKDYYRSDWQVIYLPLNKKYLIYVQEITRKERKGRPAVRFSYINMKGEKKWSKEYEAIYVFKENLGKEGEFSYYFAISKDGNRILFVRALEKERETPYPEYPAEVLVLDTLGNEIAKSKIPPYFEGDIQISPDGKIVGATIEQLIKDDKLLGRHLFFLDVETGRTKIVKAEGERWLVGYAFHPYMGTPPGKISIGIGIYEDVKKMKWIKGIQKYLSFDEIPEDLSILFKEGEK